MQSKFMAAINQLATEKNLPKDRVLEIVSHALRAAYRKDYGNRDQNIRVDLDPENANPTVFVLKDVLEDGAEMESDERQIYVSEAKKYKKDIKVGDVLEIDVTPADYGRIAAQSAKQVIIQRIQEAEKDIITEMYKDREHEILNGYVNRVEGPNVYIDLDRTQAILRPQDQIPREHYQNGQRIKVYLEKVVSTPKGPRLLISRSHPKLVNCLLELEIPEVREKVVEIKAVAREAGVRTKVAVSSNDKNVDPIGACVGQKGVRIQNIMEEFNGERIDIIEWNDDPLKMLTASLAPAKIAYIDLDEPSRRARVYVPVEERALAIGKGGQNVRLASMLTGWEVDIIDLDKLDTSKLDEIKKQELERAITTEKGGKKAEKKVEMPVAAEDIKDLPGLAPEIAQKLEAAGFVKSIQLMGLNAEALTAIEGVNQEEAEMIEKALKGELGKKEEGTQATEGTEETTAEESPSEEKPAKKKKAKKAEESAEASVQENADEGEVGSPPAKEELEEVGKEESAPEPTPVVETSQQEEEKKAE